MKFLWNLKCDYYKGAVPGRVYHIFKLYKRSFIVLLLLLESCNSIVFLWLVYFFSNFFIFLNFCILVTRGVLDKPSGQYITGRFVSCRKSLCWLVKFQKLYDCNVTSTEAIRWKFDHTLGENRGDNFQFSLVWFTNFIFILFLYNLKQKFK